MNNSEIKESKHKEMKYGPARFQFKCGPQDSNKNYTT